MADISHILENRESAKLIQRRLRAAGFYFGNIDGWFHGMSWTALLCYVANRKGATEQDRSIATGMYAILPEFGIVTAELIAQFLAQTAVESGGFNRLIENLNYSAERLMAVWPSRFPTKASAQAFAHRPEVLADKVYGGRLGNAEPGEGWKYRGRGLIQLTGKANYAERELECGLPLVAKPEMAAHPDNAVRLACLYWRSKNLNAIAASGDIVAVRKAVQGGRQGLDDARVFLSRARKALA